MTPSPVSPSPVSSAPAGLGRPLLAFFGTLVLANAIVIGLGFAFPNFEMPSSFNLIIIMISGLSGGQAFAKANGRVMTSGEQTRFSFLGVLISLALSATSLAGIFLWYGVPFTWDAVAIVMTGDVSMAADLKSWLLPILAIALLIGWGMIHLGAGIGAKGVIKRMEKEAAKGR